MNKHKAHKVFIASRKNPQQWAEAFAKVGEAFDTISDKAEEAELIIVDMEDPVLPRDWGTSDAILNGRPPIILAELGAKEDPRVRIVLDGMIPAADKLEHCKTPDDLLARLRFIEQVLTSKEQLLKELIADHHRLRELLASMSPSEATK